MPSRIRAFVALALAAGASCVPEWNDDPALVRAQRIIAIEAEPPEALPGETVMLAAIAATPEGPMTAEVEWAFCLTPKPLAENGLVSATCVTDPHPAAAPLAPSVQVIVPSDACRLFGPETPPRVGADPPSRARDPDPTGGYYQPVRAAGVGLTTFGAVRVVCNLANAPLEAAVDLRRRYEVNRNPRLAELSAIVDGKLVALDALPSGRTVVLVARWDAATPERYLAFDPQLQAVRERRESMRVSWFVTAGTVVNHHTGRAEDDLETSVTTTWLPPPNGTARKRVHLWTVLRDSRGGVSAEHRELAPQPAP